MQRDKKNVNLNEEEFKNNIELAKGNEPADTATATGQCTGKDK